MEKYLEETKSKYLCTLQSYNAPWAIISQKGFYCNRYSNNYLITYDKRRIQKISGVNISISFLIIIGKSLEISPIFRKSFYFGLGTVTRRFFLEKMKNLWTNAQKHGKTEFSVKISKNLTPFMHFEIRNFRAHHGKVSTFYWNINHWKIFL